MARKIPGTIDSELREYCYIQVLNNSVTGLFFSILKKVHPPIPKKGGAIEEKCVVLLPNKDKYFCISYKGGDVAWKEQIETGASLMNLKVARIIGGSFVVCEEEAYSLDCCVFNFY